jgi:hypothetical protein
MKKLGSKRIAGLRFRRDLLVVAGLLVLTFSALPILNQYIRARFIHQLALRVGQTPDHQVENPIRQLARLGLPAIESLVAISASARSVPAVIARNEVEQQLTIWLSQSGMNQPGTPSKEKVAERYSTFLSSRMSRLAGALAQYAKSMDVTGQHWAERVCMRILLHTDRVSPAQSVQVMTDCQTVLAAVPYEALVVHDASGFEQTVAKVQRLLIRIRPSLPWNSLATTLMANLEQLRSQVQRLPSWSAQVSSLGPTEIPIQRNREPQSRPPVLTTVEITRESGLIPRPQEQSETYQANNPVRQLTVPSELANLSEKTGNPLRQHNPEVAPAMPSQSKATTKATSKSTSNGPLAPEASARVNPSTHKSLEQVFDVPTPTEMAVRRQQLQAMPLRELMMLLGNTRDFEAALIRDVARNRGLWEMELALAPKLGSTQTTERLEILQQLSLLPARHARRWLRWLLEDEEADVRLQALAMMATTGDPQIESLARQRLLKDIDPRVVELASQIIAKR